MKLSSTLLLGAALLLPTSYVLADEQADEHHSAGPSAPGTLEHPTHDDEGHAHHVPHFSDINWFYGLIGEKEGVEANLLWRPPGTPVPLGALLINTAILFFLIGKFGGPAISGGLVSRKQRIAGEILAAAKMKQEAEEQLAHYEGKLKELGEEMQRIKDDMRAAAESDRERILADAKVQREAMERDAQKLVAQELAHARHEATLRAVSQAVQVAREQIQSSLNPQDHERVAGGLLSSLQAHLKAQENKA